MQGCLLTSLEGLSVATGTAYWSCFPSFTYQKGK